MADGQVVRQGVTNFFEISSSRGSGRVGGSENDSYRIQSSTIGQWWPMGKWSGRELLIFLKFHHQEGVGEWAALRVIAREYSHLQ